MKKKLILILALVLISVVSVLCTIAYLMEDVETENVMTVGSVHIELLEYERVNTETSGDAAEVKAFEDDKLLLPAVTKGEFNYSTPTSFVNWEQPDKIIKAGYTSPIWDPASITNEHDKMVFVRNTGNAAAYVRLYFAFEAGNYVRFDRFQEAVRINYNTDEDKGTPIWNWRWDETLVELGVGVKKERYFIATATYYKPLEPNTTTEISLSQIALHSDVTLEEARGFGDEYKVLVKAQAMQCDGFDSADAALEKGFGNAYPFKNVKEVTFVDNLRNVLTKLNGDGTDIKSKVTSVTFGLTADHIDKVREYDGVLVANKSGEAVYTAYAYYVPNGENYDIYVLADEWSIYAPVDSQKLFQGMTVLTKVDTANLDVSQTKSMNNMFNNCIALSDLDVSEWDVSEVTDFARFLHCNFDHDANSKTPSLRNEKLTSLDVSNWVTANATDMSYMFCGCTELTGLDVSKWSTADVKNTSYMFDNCKKLTSLDISAWDFGNVTATKYMFSYCSSLTEIKTSNFFFGEHTAGDKLIEAIQMFRGCSSLSSLDVSGWNVSKLKNTDSMFYDCSSLTELAVSDWDVHNVVDMEYMFNNCSSLTSDKFDVSKWNVSAVGSFGGTFNGCASLTTLDLSKWQTGSATKMWEMFQYCSSLTTVKISDWDVSKVTTMNHMFNACDALQIIDISGWDTASLTSTQNMFSFCDNLTTIYVGQGWNLSGVTVNDKGTIQHSGMFADDTNLVGGMGTTLIKNEQGQYITDKTYACIDGGKDAPGYLTEKK